MSTNQRSYNHKRNPFRAPPGFSTYYAIGMAASNRLPKFHTWPEVAAATGMTRKNAQTFGYLTLGKFLYRLVRAVGEVPEL